MDFVSDALFDGKRFRALTVVDTYTRECLAIEVDQGLKADAVVGVMERLARVLDHWAYQQQVTLDCQRRSNYLQKCRSKIPQFRRSGWRARVAIFRRATSAFMNWAGCWRGDNGFGADVLWHEFGVLSESIA